MVSRPAAESRPELDPAGLEQTPTGPLQRCLDNEIGDGNAMA
jgi:hypothetical protein